MDGEKNGPLSNVVYYPLFIFFKHSERNVQKHQKEINICAIQEHMLRHEVYLDQQYRGYYYLSQKLKKSYMERNRHCHGMSYWMIINSIVIVRGIYLSNRKDEINMTIIGELGVVYGVTGASILGIKLLKRKAFIFQDGCYVRV